MGRNHGGITGIEEKHVSALLRLSGDKTTGRMLHLPGGCGTVEYDRLLVSRGEKQKYAFQVPLPLPERLHATGHPCPYHLYDRDD